MFQFVLIRVDINGKLLIMSNVVQYRWGNLDIHLQRLSHFCDDFLKFPYPIYFRMTNILGIITIHYVFERLWILKVLVLTNSLQKKWFQLYSLRNGSYPCDSNYLLFFKKRILPPKKPGGFWRHVQLRTIMMDRQSGRPSPPAVTVDFSPPSRSAGGGAASTSREDVVPLGPGISTQTSMPPVDLPVDLRGRRPMEVQQRLGADFFSKRMAYE